MKLDFGREQKNGGRAEASRQVRHPMLFETIQEDKKVRKARVPAPVEPPSLSEKQRWFNNQVFRGRNKPFADVIEITPEIAEIFLKGNAENRPVSKTNIERLVAEINGGRWQMNGETIVIANDGSLNDGQHRCLAVIGTGCSIKSMVTFGAARESRLTTDQGIVRTVGNMANMIGIENGNTAATVAGYVWVYSHSGYITSGRSSSDAAKRPTRTQILELIDTHPEISSVVKRTPSGAPGGRSVAAFCRWAIERRAGEAGQSNVDLFFDKLTSGAGLEAGNSILVARNAILKRDARLTVNEKAFILLVAWNSFRAGRAEKKYVRTPGDPRGKLPDLRK